MITKEIKALSASLTGYSIELYQTIRKPRFDFERVVLLSAYIEAIAVELEQKLDLQSIEE